MKIGVANPPLSRRMILNQITMRKRVSEMNVVLILIRGFLKKKMESSRTLMNRGF